MYACVYVCMYVRMYVCVCTHTHTVIISRGRQQILTHLHFHSPNVQTSSWCPLQSTAGHHHTTTTLADVALPLQAVEF